MATLQLIHRSSHQSCTTHAEWMAKRNRTALNEVDQVRLRYLENLLVACGVSKAEAPARAIIAYSYMRVAGSLISPRQDKLMQYCEALLVRPS